MAGDPATATPAKRAPAGAQTVDRALQLLQMVAVAPGDGLRLSELAEASGLDRATTYRLLVSLGNRGFLDQDSATKRYTLGLAFFTLAAAASNRFDLADVARDALRLLAAATGDTGTYCLRSGSDLVCIDVETGNFPIKTLPMDIGSHRPLGAGASGIALLAALPDFEVEQVLRKVAARLAEVPGQDLASIRAAIAACREHGYALAHEEPQGRIIGLAVALINRRGRPQGTLALSGIPERFAAGRIATIAAAVKTHARSIDDAMWRMPDNDRHRSAWTRDTPAAARRRPR